MLTELFKDVITNYQDKTTTRFSKDSFVVQIVNEIPSMLVSKLKNGNHYIIKGSVGKGNWAETPWVAILDPKITSTTQQGYYVCYLINPKLKTMYLGLAVGWTQFAERFPTHEAQKRIADYSYYLLRQLKNIPSNLLSGPIDLSAEHDLSQGYEQGQILYKKYNLNELNDDTLYYDLESMLNIYTQLKDLVGSDIQNIEYEKVMSNGEISHIEKIVNRITLESNFEQVANALESLSNDLPPKRVEQVIYKLVRNPKIARLVKESKHYICEICQREPFMQKNGAPYAEADHIRPLGGDTRGLDTPDNIRCLCAQCHAIVTHGSDEEMRKILSK